MMITWFNPFTKVLSFDPDANGEEDAISIVELAYSSTLIDANDILIATKLHIFTHTLGFDRAF